MYVTQLPFDNLFPMFFQTRPRRVAQVPWWMKMIQLCVEETTNVMKRRAMSAENSGRDQTSGLQISTTSVSPCSLSSNV